MRRLVRRRLGDKATLGVEWPAVRTRLISSAILAPLFLTALWRGDMLWAGLLAIAAALAGYEGVRLFHAAGIRASGPVSVLLAPALVLASRWPQPEMLALVWATGVIAAFLGQLARPETQRSVRDWAVTLAVPAYAGTLLGFAAMTRQLQEGLAWSVLLVALVWTNDSVAFLAGRAVGRHPLAPTLSPKKTVEGAAAATFATVLLASVAPSVLARLPALASGTADWPTAALAGLGVAVSVAAPLGDLSKSFLKRSAGAKDSGRLIPGHGGLLDRLDSLMFAAPIVYVFARAFEVLP